MSWSSLTGQSKAAIIFAILGFVLSFTSTNTSSINGVVSCSYMNYGALLFGALAILAGAGGLMTARSLGDTRSLNLAVSGIGLALGVLHIGRGLGMVGGACAGL
jgi:hypothetical protein